MPAPLHSTAVAPPPGSCAASSHPALLTRRSLLVGMAATLSACGLPQQGPRSPELFAAAGERRFLLIDVDAAIARTLGHPPRSSLAGFGPTAATPHSQSVGIGDVLDIRILEAGSGGLFARGENGAGGAEFPGIVVDRDGRITLPYIGALDVDGLTPAAIETRITDALRGKAIEPQALVRIARTEGNTVTLAGDVANPGPFAVALRGSRLSQAIAGAGGSRNPAHETRVSLIRQGSRADARLSDVLLDPRSDIALQQGDLIVLTHEPARYTLTGSVGRPGTFTLPGSDYSVLEAVSAAGGPSDSRADASGLFLFRNEARDRLRAAGKTDLDRYQGTAAGLPTVYRFDMARPEMQFHASQFFLADGDALYIASAGSVQLEKILTLFGLGLGTANRVEAVTE